MIERWTIDRLDLPPLMTVQNREEVILFGAEPNDVRMVGYTIEDMLEAFYSKGDKVDMTEFKFWVDSVLPLLKNKEKQTT